MLARCNAAEGAQVFNFAKQAQPSNLSISGTPLADVFNFEKTGGCFLVFKKFFVTDEPYEVGPKEN